MKQIRINTFETNSSSTHALCMTTCDLYKRWCTGDKSVMLCYYDLTYTLVELKDIDKYYDSIGIRERYENLRTRLPISFEDYLNQMMSKYTCEDFNIKHKDNWWFEKTFTTPNGEQVIAFGYYGEEY